MENVKMPETLVETPALALKSPLHGVTLKWPANGEAGLKAAEYPNLGYLMIRGRADDAAFMAAAAQALGAPLPTRPRSVLRCAVGIVLWQSPDEWWLVCARAQRDGLVRSLEDALQGCFAQVADNSGGFTALHISGPAHLRLLNHLGPYDFERLPVGDCVSTVISKASFTVLRSGPTGVTLVFRRSFADYVWRLIERNARPYGLQLVEPKSSADGVLSQLLPPPASSHRLQPA
jgi:sarcosine oxidase subunit gamma